MSLSKPGFYMMSIYLKEKKKKLRKIFLQTIFHVFNLHMMCFLSIVYNDFKDNRNLKGSL